jgi:hypothetical protein
VNNITKRVDNREDQEKYGATPYKKRAWLDVGSPALDSNYEVTMAPLDPSLGDTPVEILRNIGTECKSLVANIDTLKELVTGAHDMSHEVTLSVMKEFGEFDFELARLSSLLGARSADMDPIPIFRSLGDLTKEVKELTDYLGALQDQKQAPFAPDPVTTRAVDFVDDVNRAGFGVKDVLEVTGFVRKYAAKGGVADTMKTTICTEVLASFQPIIGLFSKLYSVKSAPGDLLDKEIADIRSDIAVVRTVANAAAGLIPAPTTRTQWRGVLELGFHVARSSRRVRFDSSCSNGGGD